MSSPKQQASRIDTAPPLYSSTLRALVDPISAMTTEPIEGDKDLSRIPDGIG
jgi:hypothetical protein